MASANVVLGALTGGISSLLRGRSFSRGFSRGALGGAVAFVGKHVSSTHGSAAGIIGRQIGAVGSSIIRNASLDIGPLDVLVFPIGATRIEVMPRGGWRNVAWSVDLHELYWFAKALSDDRLVLDWGYTLSSGAPVFLTPASLDDGANGFTTGGLIVLTRRSSVVLQDVIAHERVHIAQIDMLKLTIGYPLESWARARVGLGDLPMIDRIVLGIGHGLIQYPLSGAWPRSGDLLEMEAEFLEGR